MDFGISECGMMVLLCVELLKMYLAATKIIDYELGTTSFIKTFW